MDAIIFRDKKEVRIKFHKQELTGSVAIRAAKGLGLLPKDTRHPGLFTATFTLREPGGRRAFIGTKDVLSQQITITEGQVPRLEFYDVMEHIREHTP